MKPPILQSDRYQIYVGGDWRPSAGSVTYPNVNPAHRDQTLGHVVECTPEEVDDAMRAAQASFPAWRNASADIRTKVFLELARLIDRHYDDLARTITREMGKTLFDASLDLNEAVGVVETVAPQGLSLKGETYPTIAPGVVMESRPEPRGVAAIITPFNFPVAIPVAQITAALVTGNTVVWKPSHLIPESAQWICSLVADAVEWGRKRHGASIPPGIFNMVTGDVEAGQAIVRHPVYQALSFTGSKAVGDSVDAQASRAGKRVMKEVGGINVFYVHRDADIERAARNFVYGKTITAGQRCTSIQEVLVDADARDAFVAAALRMASGIVMGDGASRELADADADPDRFSLPPLVSDEQRDRVLRLVDKSIGQGATLLYRKAVPPELAAEGSYAPFMIVENVQPGNVLYDTEVFGPVAVLTTVSGLAEAIEIVNGKIGIVACIDSRDKDATETFIQQVLRTRVDDGRHGTGAFWGTKFGGDRGAGSGNPALDENMAYGYCLWKTIYRGYKPLA